MKTRFIKTALIIFPTEYNASSILETLFRRLLRDEFRAGPRPFLQSLTTFPASIFFSFSMHPKNGNNSNFPNIRNQTPTRFHFLAVIAHDFNSSIFAALTFLLKTFTL
jgi:hypothetical protein